MKIQKFYPGNDELDREAIAGFLFNHLGEYGDPLENIVKCIDYTLSNDPGKGGFILLGFENDNLMAVSVVNATGMEDYIPENLLVYLAVDPAYRGKGYGKLLLEATIREAKGDIALHVEPDNPARRLYEKLGFTNKYLEMRLKNK